jgi:hypothetical protein
MRKRTSIHNLDIFRNRYHCQSPKTLLDRTSLKVQNEMPNDFEEPVPVANRDGLQIRPGKCERI